MANKSKGYVPIYRSIQDSWIWKSNEPFDRRSAWVDLLLIVNHKDNKIPVGSKIVTIRRGQRWISYRSLGTRWGWSIGKVDRFLRQLVEDNMIQLSGTPNGTLLTIVNWDNFNNQRYSEQNTERYTDEYSDRYTGDTLAIHGRVTNNNDKRMINNVKNENNKKLSPKNRYFRGEELWE